jgi:hypothetical protein
MANLRIEIGDNLTILVIALAILGVFAYFGHLGILK